LSLGLILHSASNQADHKKLSAQKDGMYANCAAPELDNVGRSEIWALRLL